MPNDDVYDVKSEETGEECGGADALNVTNVTKTSKAHSMRSKKIKACHSSDYN